MGFEQSEFRLCPHATLLQTKGAKGVGELTSLLPFDDPLVMNMMSHIEAEELPMIFHIGAAKYGEYGLVTTSVCPVWKNLATFPKCVSWVIHSGFGRQYQTI